MECEVNDKAQQEPVRATATGGSDGGYLTTRMTECETNDMAALKPVLATAAGGSDVRHLTYAGRSWRHVRQNKDVRQ